MKVCVVGATGLVGREMVTVLEEIPLGRVNFSRSLRNVLLAKQYLIVAGSTR